MPGAKGKALGGNLALMVGAVLAVCGVVEGGLRFYGYNPLRQLASGRALILKPSAHPDIK